MIGSFSSSLNLIFIEIIVRYNCAHCGEIYLDVTEPKIIEVVAGLIFKEGRLLACQRRADGAFPFKWEFPGGKIEWGEEPSDALTRELREELGIDVDDIKEVFTHTHTYSGFSTVKLKFFLVPVYRGEIINRVFEIGRAHV